MKKETKTIKYKSQGIDFTDLVHTFTLSYDIDGEDLPATWWEPACRASIEYNDIYLVSHSGERMREIDDVPEEYQERIDDIIWDLERDKAERGNYDG